MNTWGYLILIAALLVLAGVMLYARFATRSREKSLHHAPADWYLGSETLELPPMPEETVPVEEPEVRAQIRLDRAPTEPEPSPSADVSRDYLDELQEAAAGLAKLMRSSPVARPEPVVYAPETREESEPAVEESVAVAEAEEAPEPETATALAHHEPALEPVEIAAEVEPAVESVVETVFVPMEPILSEPVPMVESGEEIEVEPVEVPARRLLSLRELLGDTVADQFDRIDAELDALEELVSNIEENLILLSDYERGGVDRDAPEEDVDGIAAAA